MCFKILSSSHRSVLPFKYSLTLATIPEVDISLNSIVAKVLKESGYSSWLDLPSSKVEFVFYGEIKFYYINQINNKV